MKIANPIYDVVFKYLFEDNKIAKLFLSTLIGEQIEELVFRPQEHTLEIPNNSLTVYRLDFAATIKTGEGEHKKVLLEIQKAKLATDIMRFRRYLGKEYSNKENVIEVEKGKRKVKQAIPILNIYFLGYPLNHTEAPVVKVQRQCFDLITEKELEEKEEFIESLSHDSFVVQIPYLKEKRQNELLKLLSVFDQGQADSDDHILNVREEDFPEKYHEIIRRLQKAMSEPKIRETMDLEDEILEELEERERTILEQFEQLEKSKQALEEKEQALEENKQILEENKQALEEKEQALEEKEQALEKNKQALEERDQALKNACKALMNKGVSEEEAKKILGL